MPHRDITPLVDPALGKVLVRSGRAAGLCLAPGHHSGAWRDLAQLPRSLDAQRPSARAQGPTHHDCRRDPQGFLLSR